MSASDDRIVIFGAGVSGVRIARRIRALDSRRPIILIGDENRNPYDRPPLSKEIIAGDMPEEGATILTPAEAHEHGIEMHLGTSVRSLDTASQVAFLGDGSTLAYGSAVIASGARARHLPEMAHVSGVHTIRSLPDALTFKRELDSIKRLVIIGAGFIGLEVASVARQAGIKVSVIESAAVPLSRVLPAVVGHVIAQLHVGRGVDLRLSRSVAEVIGGDRVEAVVLDDGTRIEAQALMVGAGAVPNTEWLDGSGVVVGDGVVCDSRGRTSVGNVFAVGDASRWTNLRTGTSTRTQQWQAAVEQADIVGHNLVNGADQLDWDAVPYFWSTQFGVRIQLCGSAGPTVEPIADGDGWIFGDGESLTGVLAMNKPRIVGLGRKLVASKTSWSDACGWAASLATDATMRVRMP